MKSIYNIMSLKTMMNGFLSYDSAYKSFMLLSFSSQDRVPGCVGVGYTPRCPVPTTKVQ